MIILLSDPKKIRIWGGNSGGHHGIFWGRDSDNKMTAQKGKFYLIIQIRLIIKK